MQTQLEGKALSRRTAIFVCFFLLAGVANLFSRQGLGIFGILLTCANYLILIGLLVFWIQSVRVRLLPSRGRAWVLSAAVLMLTYQLLRTFKYRFAVDILVFRYTVYLYFVPMTMIPALFLMTCVRIRRGNRPGRWHEALLLIPPGLLSLLALTNDLHGLVYAPKIDLASFTVATGTYTNGPVFYLMYGWMILCLALGLALLTRETRPKAGKAPSSLLAVAFLWLGMLLLYKLIFDPYQTMRMYNMPEINTFGLLAVFEVCIRYRLIPRNENYPGFFQNLHVPALITDRKFQPVYRSGNALSAAPEALRESVGASVYLTPDVRLSGRVIQAGYAFWTEDESAVHLAQERLAEANEFIEQENTLIQAETEQKEKDAYLQSRHRIYHEIAAALYPCQQRIERLLNQMDPKASNFRDRLAFVSVLNAYVKRKSNLMLMAAEKETLITGDLFAALDESARYLTLSGLQTSVMQGEEEFLSASRIIALYDAFEAVAEQLIGKTPSLMVSWRDHALCLAAETDRTPDVAGISLPVRARQVESTLYLDLGAGKGGEEA